MARASPATQRSRACQNVRFLRIVQFLATVATGALASNGGVLRRLGVLNPTTHLSGRPVQCLRDPIRLVRIGEQRWSAKNATDTNHNPIRLVRMVEKIESMVRTLWFQWVMQPHRPRASSHSPSVQGVCRFSRGFPWARLPAWHLLKKTPCF